MGVGGGAAGRASEGRQYEARQCVRGVIVLERHMCDVVVFNGTNTIAAEAGAAVAGISYGDTLCALTRAEDARDYYSRQRNTSRHARIHTRPREFLRATVTRPSALRQRAVISAECAATQKR